MKKNETILSVISMLFIFLFMYTALSKWLDFQKFTDSMKNQPFESKYLSFLLYGIPSLEIIASGLLLYGTYNGSRKILRAGFYLSELLMICFTVYIILIKANYFDYTPCSCGGVIKKMSWGQHLVFNLFFVLIGFLALLILHSTQQIKTSKTNISLST